MGKKRPDIILDILKQQGYVTVKYLTEALHYSTATINRDLNYLQKQRLVKRHYGGVELLETKSVPLVFRYHKMRPAKNVIAKRAAEFITDGDTVFIDGSTTTQYMAQYITDRKNLTVITNNMMLACHLSEYGIKCICLGGRVVEPPYMLGGSDTEEAARSYTADKLFFATGGFTDDGYVTNGELYFNLNKILLKNAKQIFYMADHEKSNHTGPMRVLCDLSNIDYVITDHIFCQDTVRRFGKEKFITVETPISQTEE